MGLVASHFKQGWRLCTCCNVSAPVDHQYNSLSVNFVFCSCLIPEALFLDLGLKYSFNILKSNYLCSPKHNGLIAWTHNLELVTNNYSNNNMIKNKVEGTDKGQTMLFSSLLIYLFSILSTYPLRSQPLYIMLISTVQLHCYDTFLRAFICLW